MERLPVLTADPVFERYNVEVIAAAWFERSRTKSIEARPENTKRSPDPNRFIIASKEAAGRARDLESLPRLRSFRDYWKGQR
jgi:hypothetical protein